MLHELGDGTVYGDLRQQLADALAERDTLLLAIQDARTNIGAGQVAEADAKLQAVQDTIHAAPMLRALYRGQRP